MSAIEVSTLINATPNQVWASIEDINSHTEWMLDAVAIRFTGNQTEGLGTRFECDTVVGPIKLVDVMEITAWEPGRTMGVRHQGIVTGTGEFTIEPYGNITRFVWAEELIYPWYLGGPIGAVVGGPIMRAIWKRNLASLRTKVESELAAGLLPST